MVIIETSKGNIEVELFEDKAPETVKNFLKYVDKGHYSGTIFHRVIPNFMIQGGGMTADMNEKPTDKGIKNEADNGLSNKRGTLAMARTSDPHSASAQFFINVKDNGFLDHTGKTPQGWGYAVFGEVKSGMDVVEAIKSVKTASRMPHDDVPVEPITIKSVKLK
ncbi:MAG: peptidylprolyl isomerase [Bdellovibrionaceae bacterium]|nr:peptidylprolyl isomerase [Pseudobdellovibrionaceae bacterium]